MKKKGKNHQLAIFIKSKFIRNSNEFNRLYTYRAQKRTHTCKSQYKLHSHKKKLVQATLIHAKTCPNRTHTPTQQFQVPQKPQISEQKSQKSQKTEHL